jgi:hypothetical protein
MPTILKRNAVIVVALAALFFWVFMFAKHDPALRDVIPFGEDPYDAVGSFAVMVGMLIALVSLVRAFRPYPEAPSKAQRMYLVRSQEAVVLAVFITLAADAISMARYPAIWMGTASRDRLIALLAGMTVIAVAVQMLILVSQEKLPKRARKHWIGAATAIVLILLILAWYPEQLTHLLTVIAGDVVLFAPMPALLVALVPYPTDEGRIEGNLERGRFSTAGKRWGIVVVVGALIGIFAFMGEMSEGIGALAMSRLVLVASVFIGLGLAGILIAYGLLAKPLGLGQRG